MPAPSSAMVANAMIGTMKMAAKSPSDTNAPSRNSLKAQCLKRKSKIEQR
jgi:hypothetical protein